MGPVNGIVGQDFGTELPQTEVLVEQRAEEKSMAKFSRTKEFKALKSKIEERIEFYQKCLPDGRPLTAVDETERASQWIIANVVIGEFKAIIASYEQAKEAVEDNG